MHTHGTGRVELGGRQQVVRAHDVCAVHEESARYGWSGTGGSQAVVIDAERLGVPVDVVLRASFRLHASPLHDLVPGHLRGLRHDPARLETDPGAPALASATTDLVRALLVSAAHDAGEQPTRGAMNDVLVVRAETRDLLDATAARLLAAPSMELIRAAIAAEPDTTSLAVGTLHETLGLRILEYMRTQLAERDLTPARVAAAHHISVRHLYSVLARSGVGFGEWVGTQRLDACRRELSRIPPTTETIADLAHRWGFKSPSHFSRAFKDAYGLPPQAWREVRYL
ncbi:helix-turn-helix transcriptional regulator [Streptomyces sp. NPDC004393]|uniref:helix-turn-helix transcriptional regulator n=1 Tax=Streptomyces sp. NPDC004533 TaxID=3154278 RepID=UPI00339EF262